MTAPIRWESAHRIIRTIYPPVALFEDIAPDDWSPAQTFGATARADGADGIIYPSVRHPAGLAAAIFWPDCVKRPVTQARQFRYHWDGARMSRYLVHGTREWIAMA